MEDIDNIRACYRWAITNRRFDFVRKTVHGLVLIFHYQGWFVEAREFFEQAHQALQPLLIKSEENKRTHGLVLLALGWFQCFTGDDETGEIKDGKGGRGKYLFEINSEGTK